MITAESAKIISDNSNEEELSRSMIDINKAIMTAAKNGEYQVVLHSSRSPMIKFRYKNKDQDIIAQNLRAKGFDCKIEQHMSGDITMTVKW